MIQEAQDRPGDDPIFSLDAEATARAQRGERILNATLGALYEDDGRLAVMRSVFEAMARVEPERAAAYAPIAAPPAFLDCVTKDLYEGHALHAHSLAVGTPGGTGAIYNAVVNFLEPKQKLLTTSFYWSPYAILANHARRGVETFRMFDSAGDFDAELFEAALTENMRAQGRSLVVLNSPCHNPTGFSLDDREWGLCAEILERACERGPVALCLDYAYAEFAADRDRSWRDRLAPLVDRMTLLVAWTASKSFTQYGARVGALVASHADPGERSRLLNALRYTCRGTWSNCNHLGMNAIAEVLRTPESRAKLGAERDRLRALLGERVAVFNECARDTGLRYPRYEGGFFVSVFTPDAKEVAKRCKERGLFVVPLQGAVRVALCAIPSRDIPFLVEILSDSVKAVEELQRPGGGARA